MKSPIPVHAKRIEVGGEAAWLWEIKFGWRVFQWPYEVDLENCEQGDKTWHTIDYGESDSPARFRGGLVRYEPGHMAVEEFLPVAERVIGILREKNAPPEPPRRED
ncbi:MAG TPA: hypothetical protein VG820_00700 [Fimbriimonadaceae bacterium]|nr:hypothetical protein [Fimbriimonadaceae bacterium]